MTQLIRRCRVFPGEQIVRAMLPTPLLDTPHEKMLISKLPNKTLTPEYIRAISKDIIESVINDFEKDACEENQDLQDPIKEILVIEKMLRLMTLKKEKDRIIDNINETITKMGVECECPLPEEDCKSEKK
jgi:hypothetical protein